MPACSGFRPGKRAEKTKRSDPPKWYRTFQLPLLGSNQDSPDPESSRPGRHFRQFVGKRPLSEHRCPLPGRSLPARARRNYGKTTALPPFGSAPASPRTRPGCSSGSREKNQLQAKPMVDESGGRLHMPKTATSAPREGSCKAVADPDVAPAGVGPCHAGALGAQGVTNAAAQGTILGADSVRMPEATVLATNTSNGKRWQGVTRGDVASSSSTFRWMVRTASTSTQSASSRRRRPAFFSRWESVSRLTSDSTRPLELPPLLAQRSEFADPLARHQGPRYLDMNSIQAAPT
jgi:hypothetical protein